MPCFVHQRGVVSRLIGVAAVVFLCAPARSVSGQASRTDSAAVVAAVSGFHGALTEGDSMKATSYLANDVVVLESGVAQSRADYLGHHLGADMKASKSATGKRTITQVTVVGTAAYLIATTFTPGNTTNPQGSDMVELMVLSQSPSGWQIRAVHWSSRRRRA